MGSGQLRALDTRLDRKAITRTVLEQVTTWRTQLTSGTADARRLPRDVLVGPVRFTPG